MKEFTQTINEISRNYVDRSVDAADPEQFFKRVTNELIDQYDILNSPTYFNEAKAHLLSTIKTGSGLTQNQQDQYLDRVNDLEDINRMLMFLEQEIIGL